MVMITPRFAASMSGKSRLAGKEGAGQVQVERLVPELQVAFEHRGAADQSAGVDDQHFDRPELFLDLGDEGLRRVRLRQVALDGDARSLRRDRLRIRFAGEVAERDLCAFRRKSLHNSAADSRGAAGDQNDLAFKLAIHSCSLVGAVDRAHDEMWLEDQVLRRLRMRRR